MITLSSYSYYQNGSPFKTNLISLIFFQGIKDRNTYIKIDPALWAGSSRRRRGRVRLSILAHKVHLCAAVRLVPGHGAIKVICSWDSAMGRLDQAIEEKTK